MFCAHGSAFFKPSVTVQNQRVFSGHLGDKYGDKVFHSLLEYSNSTQVIFSTAASIGGGGDSTTGLADSAVGEQKRSLASVEESGESRTATISLGAKKVKAVCKTISV